MVRIEATGTSITDLRNVPRISGSGTTEAAPETKTIGETPPIPVSLAELGELAALFGRGGIVAKLKRRLNKLKGKQCRVTPAKGTIACVDDQDLVYLGVEFLQEYHDQEDVLAGVMAHEWGHACARKPKKSDVQKLNWNEIFELRREHETLADEISGRLLALMGYKPDNLIKFLTEEKRLTHNLKYHDSQTRAQIVAQGYREEMRKIQLALDLFPSSGSSYRNNYQSKIVDDDV